MVGYQPLKHKGLGNFFRMVLHCLPHPTDAEMDFVLDEIERIGAEIAV
jgi:sulfinoalanine decarboxylase